MAINEIISQTIKDTFDKYKTEILADQTYIGTVTAVLGRNQYMIHYADATRPFTTKSKIPLSVGQTVHIRYPLGKHKNMYMEEDLIYSLK